MNFEIKSEKKLRNHGEVTSVMIGYQAKSKSRTLHCSGTFELTPQEYEDKSQEDLLILSRELFEKEINAK